jgi:Flp pilus assembly protein TadD
VVQTNPNKTAVRANLANALWLNKDYEGAKFHYAEVLHRDKNNAEALNGMGLWYLQNSRLPDAKTSFQASIRSNPNNALAYNNLAVTLERMNQRKQAIALLERAAKMAPDNQQIQKNLKRMKASG